MSYDLNTYFQDIEEISDYVLQNPFIGSFYLTFDTNDNVSTDIKVKIERASSFRYSIIDKSDLAKISPFVDFIEDSSLRERNAAYFIFLFDLQNHLNEKNIKNRCKNYEVSDAIFNGTGLWDRRTTKGKDLIEILHSDNIDDEVVKIGDKYFRLDRGLNTQTIRLLKVLFNQFPNAKLWLRLSSNEIYDDKPLKYITEEVIIPAEKHWWRKLKVYHNGNSKIAEYQNVDTSLPDNLDRYWDKNIIGIDKLQVEWHRKDKDTLSMMMEELPENVSPTPNYISSLLIHLTCKDRVGVNFENATIDHIDGALNVYFGDSINYRLQSRLNDKIKAKIRTHLFRIEGIPLNSLLPISSSFFKTQTLVKDWLKDQFNITE